MSEYCIICECEPVDMVGWVKSKKYPDEWVCPWCIKEGKYL